MTRNLFFLLFLLAAISVINAIPHKLNRRTSVFGQCPLSPALPTFDATIVPDPVVGGQLATYNISGTAQTDFPDDAEIIILISDAFGQAPYDSPFGGDFCNIPGNPPCPIKAGTSFNRLFSSVQTPDGIPSTFTDTILIMQADTTTSTIACAVATVA
ncbi:11249_t:CDS:1 [Paraglomus brasilianum]|uniref:Phosphatidylglycerol/phosphatidylinositol transfer protein n=1 Tax=Paraglomus brasilianum TaxID=144538 RepID=A0A9N9CCK7_9GLOM|nr:11249_t:CDS:1 [Paraglomus brasilianum]